MGRGTGGNAGVIPARRVTAVLIAAFVASPGAHAQALSPERQIRAARAASNAAIAAHDVARRDQYLPDFTILPGSSGLPLGREAFLARMRTTFADPTFTTYVRTPDRIQISSTGKRAAEVGRWTGSWRKPDGEMRLTGIYQAMWVPTSDGWRLRNESFVTLGCSGSQECATLD